MFKAGSHYDIGEIGYFVGGVDTEGSKNCHRGRPQGTSDCRRGLQSGGKLRSSKSLHGNREPTRKKVGRIAMTGGVRNPRLGEGQLFLAGECTGRKA